MENNQEKNTEIKTIKIGAKMVMQFIGLTHEGLGIAKIEGYDEKGTLYENFPIFVLGALPYEQGIVEITKLTKSFGYGKMLKPFADTYTKDRAVPMCGSYPTCGGCNIMHMTYDAQLRFKREMVKETLERIGTIRDVRVEPVLGAKQPFYYRNKVQIPFGESNYKTVAGFYKCDTHRIIPLKQCFIQSDISTNLTIFVKNLCNEYNIKGYDEKYHKGDLRHILIKTNAIGEIMLVLVVLHDNILHLDEITEKIVRRYPNIKSVILNLNRTRGNTVMGDKSKVLYGESYLTDTLCGFTFRIGATSFYQVNHDQTEVLYQTALKIADLKKEDNIIDAYCGIGTIGIIASSKVNKVYGVEIVPEAIENAKTNVKLNHVTNAEYVCNKAEDQIISWMESGINISTIIVDPPRKGCDEKLLETIVKMKIGKVLYISCNPATLARDVKYLAQNEYKVKMVQPVDMFPQSSHIETIILLTLK